MFNKKQKTMPKAKNSTKGAKKQVTPLYKVKQVTKNSDRKLWVAFKKGRPTNGLVFSSVLTRDAVRNATRKIMGLPTISDIRSCRLSTFRKRTSK